MERDTYSARTLEELPTHPSQYGMQAFRHTCEDDELWNRYLAQLKSFYHADLLEKRRAELLEQYLSWDIIEDRATLENASRLEVRKHFNRWVTEQNVPTLPAKAITNMLPIQLPRFKYCVYVDKDCLNTLLQFQEANDGTALFAELLPPMVFALIDRTWTLDGTNDSDIRDDETEHEEDESEENESEEDEEEEDEDKGGYPLLTIAITSMLGGCTAMLFMWGLYMIPFNKGF